MVSIDAEVNHPSDCLIGPAAMQSTDHQMAGESGGQAGRSRGAVADFADDQHVHILPQCRSQRFAVAEAAQRSDRDLGQAGDAAFDRIFDGDDLAIRALVGEFGE